MQTNIYNRNPDFTVLGRAKERILRLLKDGEFHTTMEIIDAGGASGAAYALGPTGGYLVGFVAAAYVTGWLAERGWDRRAWSTVLAMVAGNAAIYGLGLAWLAVYAGRQTLALGLLPYLAGDAVKVTLAAVLLPMGWRLIGEQRADNG